MRGHVPRLGEQDSKSSWVSSILTPRAKKFQKIIKKPVDFPIKKPYSIKMKALLNKLKLAIADSKLGLLTNPVYRLKYRPYTDHGNKEVYDYLVSRPFDGFENGFTAYCFGKGVRRFRFDEIVDRQVVNIFGKSVA